MEAVPATVHIRPEAVDDHENIRGVVAAAFGRATEASLVERIRASPQYVPDLAIVAEIAGGVVGHVMISMATICSSVGERSICMLSPLAVAPEHHNKGIGQLLVRIVVAAADDRGEPLVILEGSPGYYARLGFEPAAGRGIQIPLPDWAPAEAAQVILLSSFDPGETSLQGRVIYPPAFDGVN